MGSLAGKRVLVTRPLGDEDELSDLLRGRGAVPIAAPAIAFTAPDDPAPFDRALRELAGFKWCAFTSVRGVDAFFDRLAAWSESPPEGLRFAAVGPKTSAALGARGRQAALVPGRFSAHDVAAALNERLGPGDPVLIVRAQEGRESLVDSLRAAGRDLTVVAAYKTLPARDPALAAPAAEADIWTFASGSAVAGIAGSVPGAIALARTKIVACIGPATADAARAAGLEPQVVAASLNRPGTHRGTRSASGGGLGLSLAPLSDFDVGRWSRRSWASPPGVSAP